VEIQYSVDSFRYYGTLNGLENHWFRGRGVEAFVAVQARETFSMENL